MKETVKVSTEYNFLVDDQQFNDVKAARRLREGRREKMKEEREETKEGKSEESKRKKEGE